METNVVTQKLGGVLDLLVEHRNKVLIAILGAAVAVAAYFGYGYYHRRVQEAAHQSFISAMKLFEKPVLSGGKSGDGFISEQDKWTKVEEAFRLGYKKNSSSTLASMFLAFQSTALVHLNKTSEAIATMKQAIASMKSNALKAYYEITLALMQLDSNNKDEQADALNRLRTIAFDATHLAQGQALYHLGLYAWTHKNFDDVKNYWEQFMKKFGVLPGFEQQTSLVEERLNLLIVT